jgi:CO/xanthine dehydrogenase FAD-binding subunit
MIRHFVPTTLEEALRIINKNNCYIMSGGTDLMVQKHVSTGLLPQFDRSVLYVMGLKELDYIKQEEDGSISIGTTTRFVDIEKSPLVPEIYKRVIKEIASPNIRNMATMTGNIANASPAGDSIVPLVLNDAYVVLESRAGERKVLVKDFILGVRKIDKKPEEIITKIVILPQNLEYFYRKVGSRKAESITKVSVMIGYRIEKNIIKDFRVAFGSVATKVVRNLEVENKYKNIKVSDLDIDAVINDYSPLVTPITDQRSNKEYRHKVAMNLLRKYLEEIKGGQDE